MYSITHHPCMQSKSFLVRTWPGLTLCGAVGLAALCLEHLEAVLSGRAWLEGLVLAIVIGTILRTAWKPPHRFQWGIHFASKTLLEAAVVIMGATVSFGTIAAAGTPLLLGIAATVFATIGLSFALGRALRLPPKMALLIACGNSICGNSAIAAVAPVIDADGDVVATAIAFTAVLGIAVVLLLPPLAHGLGLGSTASGVLAGLTVYAVPQVFAAASPMGVAAVQTGTVVKLVRVLMLGPVVTLLSLLKVGRDTAPQTRDADQKAPLLPGFILAFLALATARSMGFMPESAVEPAHALSNVLTIVSMAGLGLGVDLRHVTAAGPRVSLAVTLSLLALGVFALAVIRLAGLA